MLGSSEDGRGLLLVQPGFSQASSLPLTFLGFQRSAWLLFFLLTPTLTLSSFPLFLQKSRTEYNLTVFCLPSLREPASMMASTEPCCLAFSSLEQQSLSQLSRADVGSEQAGVRLLKLGHRDTRAFPWSSPILRGESGNYTGRTLQRSSGTAIWWWTELSCQQSQEWVILERDPPPGVNPSEDCSPRQYLEIFSQNQPANYSWILTHRSCVRIDVYSCFKLLNLGIICYAVININSSHHSSSQRHFFQETFTINIKGNK